MFKPKLLATVTAAVAVLGASVAFAQEIIPAPEIDNFVSMKTRAQVVAETQDAVRRGLIPRNDQEIERLADQRYQSQKSRAQVRAETLVAIRLGLLQYGETAAPQATPEQLEQIRVAGLRALEAERQLARR